MSEYNLGVDAMRRISNSEVNTWLACERKYYYQFDLNLTPIKTGSALNRGVLGHDILATYYEARKQDRSHGNAVHLAREQLMLQLQGGFQDMETVTDLDRILQGYWGYYGDESSKYRVLEVEKQYELPMSTDFDFVMRLDVLMLNLATGETELWDHKFVYDFWGDYDMSLNPQFPKYMGALRANGINVDKAVLNQIRYRKLKNPTPDDLFRRSPYKPSQAKVENAMREQIVASKRIYEHRMLPIEVRKDTSIRTINKMTCKGCPVADLCLSEFDGGDITYMIQSDYKTNTYGYNEPTVEELL